MEDQHQNATTSGSPAPAFDLRELVVYALGRFRYQIAIVAGLGLVFGLFLALTLPNVYESTGRFLVRLGKRESIRPESVMGGQPSAGPGIAIQEEIQILRSSELFERVARMVGHDRLLEPFDAERWDSADTPVWTRWQHGIQAWWFERTHPGQTAEPDPDSELGHLRAAELVQALSLYADYRAPSILYVSFEATSPELARDVVNAAMQVCQRRHSEVFASQYSESFVLSQLAESEEEYELATQEYHEHRRECGFYDLETQRSDLLTRRSEVISALNLSEVRMRTVEKLMGHYGRELEVTPEMVMTMIDAQIVANPIHTSLQERVKEQRTELAALPIKFKRDTELYNDEERRLRGMIATLEEQLAETDPQLQIADEHEKELPNPRFAELEVEIARLEAEKVGLLNTLENLAEQETELEAELESVLACEPSHLGMQQRVDRARTRAGLLTSTQAQAEALARLDAEEELSNLVILESATFNPDKAGPERGKLVLKALGGGLALGVLIALLRQLLDSKVRFPGSLERSLGVRILGVIPEQSAWRRMGKRLRPTTGVTS